MTDLPILGAILFASVLGVRHGLDWDHLTAIADLVSVRWTYKGIGFDHIRRQQVRSVQRNWRIRTLPDASEIFRSEYAALLPLLGLVRSIFRRG